MSELTVDEQLLRSALLAATELESERITNEAWRAIIAAARKGIEPIYCPLCRVYLPREPEDGSITPIETPLTRKLAADSLKERLRKGVKCVYLAAEKSVADDLSDMLTQALARIEELEGIIDHHCAARKEYEATIAKLEGENKRLRGIDEWIDNELSKVTMLESRVTDRDETIATLQGKLDRAIDGLQKIAATDRAGNNYALNRDACFALARSILSDLSPDGGKK